MGIIGDIAGSIIGGNASKKAAKAQVKSAQAAIEEQRRQFDQTRTDLAPWRDAGAGALNTLTGRLSDLTTPPDPSKFRADPGYQFAFDEGTRAVQGSAAAKGLLHSGGTLKDLTRFGTGLADQAYNTWYNREMGAKDNAFAKLSSVSNSGLNAGARVGEFGANAASNIGNLLTQQGNARASGYVGQANAWIGGINNANDRLSSIAKMFGG